MDKCEFCGEPNERLLVSICPTCEAKLDAALGDVLKWARINKAFRVDLAKELKRIGKAVKP